MFYKADIPWFGIFANSMIWVLIVASAAFITWLAYDMITGSRKQREEVERMLTGLDATSVVTGAGALKAVSERDSMPVAGERKSPFAPGQGKRRKLTTGS